RIWGRLPVAHPLADETGSLEAGTGRLDVPAEDSSVEGGGLRDVDGRDLQVRKLAMDRLARPGSLLPVVACHRVDPIPPSLVSLASASLPRPRQGGPTERVASICGAPAG